MSLARRTRSSLGPALLAALLACGGDGGGDGDRADAAPDGFDRRALVTHLGTQVIRPQVDDFLDRAGALDGAIGAYCAALGGAGEAAARDTARQAWRESMGSWQALELMKVGPAAMDSGALRDRIYAWPTVSPCAVDQGVMLRHDDPGGFDIGAQLVNRRGLAAVEYLLFNENLATVCPPTAAPPGWDALADADKRAARCGYAQVAAGDVLAAATTLRDAWSPSDGDYATVLAAMPSAQEALNLVSDAMFYLDLMTKDMKLAEPAGLTITSCGAGVVCPAELETPWSDASKEAIVANLRAFQLLYTGGDGDALGFDDWLRALGAGDVADAVSADIAAAIAAVEAIPGTLREALTASPQAVAAAHAAVKKVTDHLKTEFLTVLGLTIPDEAASDND